jgi:hypothetical protein
VDQVDVTTSDAVQESQTSEAVEAKDQSKPTANENVEDGASDPVEVGLENTELTDAEVDDQLSVSVPLEGRCYIT